MEAKEVKKALLAYVSEINNKSLTRFYKTNPGQYAEGDKFIAIKVPDLRKVALVFRNLPLMEVKELLHSPIHQYRLTALFILIDQYKRGDKVIKKRIADLYFDNRKYVNNWDLVDSSASYILGDYLKESSPEILFRLAKSNSLWERRIAIVATFAWIRDGRVDLTLKIVTMLLDDKEDLIHKACGWALREVGKKNHTALLDFLDKNSPMMSRTTLRYSLERLSSKDRQRYMMK